MDPKYYESHVTVEPAFGARLELLVEISKKHGFKVADLLMWKHPGRAPERSESDTFTTGRDKDFAPLKGRMERLEDELESAGFQVWRAKIEAVLLDKRYREKAPSNDNG